jgi:hypothetical protein
MSVERLKLNMNDDNTLKLVAYFYKLGFDSALTLLKNEGLGEIADILQKNNEFTEGDLIATIQKEFSKHQKNHSTDEDDLEVL